MEKIQGHGKLPSSECLEILLRYGVVTPDEVRDVMDMAPLPSQRGEKPINPIHIKGVAASN